MKLKFEIFQRVDREGFDTGINHRQIDINFVLAGLTAEPRLKRAPDVFVDGQHKARRVQHVFTHEEHRPASLRQQSG